MSALNIVRKFFPKVTKVVDAETNAKIEVTKRDSNSAQVRQHDACAMAVACKRKFHLDGVIISRSVAYLIKGKQARRFKLPPSVEKEIVSFDRGGGFSEGKYELTAVCKTNKLGARGGRKDLAKDRKHTGEDIRKRFRHLTKGVRSVLGGQHSE